MKIAIIIGGADCVWSDYELWKQLHEKIESELAAKLGYPDYLCVDFETFVINDSIAVFRDYMDNAVTLHPNKLQEWAHNRNAKGLNIPGKVWAHRPFKLVTRTTDDWGGSSGLFACKIALEQGFKKIILCGVPMSPEQNHIIRNKLWTAAPSFQRAWISHHSLIYGFVKSFTGWTKQRLGEPTLEWLREV